MKEEIKWECPRCEKINEVKWANAMIEYQKCSYCGVTCDLQIVVTLEGIEVIE